ncbi:MAG: DinB family protein [Chloroflexota bacterium]
METVLKTGVWQQFGAALDMFENAINICPDDLWTTVLWKDDEDVRYGTFWFIASHTLSWLDLFLTGSSEGFVPPLPFIRGKLPDTPYTKADVCAYLNQCRQKARATIEGLTDETAYRICKFDWMEPTFLELQLYSMRHIQEHAAQLNFLLGQKGLVASDWVAMAGEKAT